MAECPREQEVVSAVSGGHWPERCDEELRAHAAGCPICAEVAAIAAALQADRGALWREAHVPPAGRVWWRAEMRARHEAARKAAQPITIAQAVAGASVVGLLFALVQIAWPSVAQSFEPIAVLKTYLLLPQLAVPIAIAVAACVVVMPLALYLVFSDK